MSFLLALLVFLNSSILIGTIPLAQAQTRAHVETENLNRNESTLLSQFQTLDLGTHKITASTKRTKQISFDVGEQTMSLLFSAVSKNDAGYFVEKVIAPDGKIYPTEKLTRSYEHNLASALFPNDGTIGFLPPGRWGVVIKALATVANDAVQVTVVQKTTLKLKHKKARFSLNFYLTGSHGVTSKQFLSSDFGTEVEAMREIFAGMGIIVDIKSVRDIDKRFQNISTYVDENQQSTHAPKLLKSVQTDADSIDIFVVDSIWTEETEVQGISFGAPSNWSSNSIIVSSRPFDPLMRMHQVRSLIAHELGHLFGLFHTEEIDGLANHLSDANDWSHNFMIPWTLEANVNYEFSKSQIAVIKNHPLVQLLD